MDRLILFRHGKAEQESESGDDFDRKLAPRGERESAAMGAHLAELGLKPDLALVSSAARARETWAAAAPAFPGAEARFDALGDQRNRVDLVFHVQRQRASPEMSLDAGSQSIADRREYELSPRSAFEGDMSFGVVFIGVLKVEEKNFFDEQRLADEA